MDLKLQHIGTSTLKCSYLHAATNFGCRARNEKIGVVVTDQYNNVIIPEKTLLDSKKEFSLAGFHANSDHIIFSNYTKPVLRGQKMRLWYSQDLFNTEERGNSGSSCSDVYAKFC